MFYNIVCDKPPINILICSIVDFLFLFIGNC